MCIYKEREKDRERESDRVFIYSKTSQIEKRAVSLYNWTGYFYTMLTSWAVC